jgi:CheY-like chemotaxis protein
MLCCDDVSDNRRLLNRALKRKLESVLNKHAEEHGTPSVRIEVDEAEDGNMALQMVTGVYEVPMAGSGEGDVTGYMTSRLRPVPRQDALTRYDVITMDAEMPVMSGFEATKLIRAAGYTGLLFGCTGNALEEDQRLFIQQGADGVYIKPIDIAGLAQQVASRLAHGAGATSSKDN